MAKSSDCAARRGRLHTPHGTVELPCFMPVGTQATVKGLTVPMVRETGAEILLGNTYHLAVRPGTDLIARLGGLHTFMGWDRPILTDSGGFQIFSLGQNAEISEEGAVFRSHVDGRKIELTPERAMQAQAELGSDIAMVLDHVVALPNPPEIVRAACERSIRWAERCRAVAGDQTQFAIVQGGLDAEMRLWSAEELTQLDFPGYAIGGLSVGESPEEMYRILQVTCPVLPERCPRYLMGVGRPQDILESVRLGVDMFDCVMPTRNARNALAFTDEGPIRLRNACHREDPRPVDAQTPSAASGVSRSYLRHLFAAGEMLGPILTTSHNLAYYQCLMREIRDAIEADTFMELYNAKMRGWQQGPANG
ncbi:MAG TPA: tRNA guanosine(34) transglycosylase Tgt [Planctomycetaceae bacterium]|nr:tRNA guanosine(34) transglycosylase Tgt [Planctomycetaceae bacterium]